MFLGLRNKKLIKFMSQIVLGLVGLNVFSSVLACLGIGWLTVARRGLALLSLSFSYSEAFMFHYVTSVL